MEAAMQRRRADGVGTAAGGVPDPDARATAAVTVANVASRRIALRCQRVGAQHRCCAVLHGRCASCLTGRRDGACGRPGRPRGGRPSTVRTMPSPRAQRSGPVPASPTRKAMSRARGATGLLRCANKKRRPVLRLPPFQRRHRERSAAIQWRRKIWPTLMVSRRGRTGSLRCNPHPCRHPERSDAAQSRRWRVRNAVDLACGATGLLRCARKDGMVTRLCIFQDTRPPHSFIKRDRLERTV